MSVYGFAPAEGDVASDVEITPFGFAGEVRIVTRYSGDWQIVKVGYAEGRTYEMEWWSDWEWLG